MTSIIGEPANAEMVEGYLDGFKDDRPDFPESLANRGHSYRHGWLNGRDDRIRRPRASFDALKRAGDLAMVRDEWPSADHPHTGEGR